MFTRKSSAILTYLALLVSACGDSRDGIDSGTSRDSGLALDGAGSDVVNDNQDAGSTDGALDGRDAGSTDAPEFDSGPRPFLVSLGPSLPTFLLAGERGLLVAGSQIYARYGYDGEVIWDRGGGDTPTDVSMGESDSHFRLVGTTNLVRHLEDGSLDEAFDGDGSLRLDDYSHPRIRGEQRIHAIAITSMGGSVWLFARIFEAMTSDDGEFLITKLDSTGALDPEFGQAGLQVVGVPEGLPVGRVGQGHIGVQTDGTLVVASTINNDQSVVFTLRPNGDLNEAFGTDGFVLGLTGRADVRPVVDGLGRILLYSGRELRRLLADGTPDTLFGSASVVSVEEPIKVAIDLGSQLVVVSAQNVGIDRLGDSHVDVLESETGSLDDSLVLSSFSALAAAVDSAGGLFVSGCVRLGSLGSCGDAEVRKVR